MSNLSNAEIAADLWNKNNDVAFSELSDAKRTELEVAVANGVIDEPEEVSVKPKKHKK